MGVVNLVKNILKGKKKMPKSVIKISDANFVQYNEALNENDELSLSGLDGNSQSFQQTLPVVAPAALFFNPVQRAFVTVPLPADQVTDDLQFVKVIRAVA